MKIYAQHGFNSGNKILEGLRNQAIDGVIYGAKDIAPDLLQADLAQIAQMYPSSTRLFDPHYYATLIASVSGARLGKLIGEGSYSYFRAHIRRDLEQTKVINDDIRSCLEFQASLPLTAFISPNIVIRRSFDSIEGAIAKNFIRNAAEQAKEISPEMPVYATLAVSENALQDKNEMQAFLQEITELDDPPVGFYLLLEKPDGKLPDTLTDQDILSRWMLVNYALKINGFEVINGYTDLLAPYIAATGADAIGTGWFGTLKTFSLQRFLPSDLKSKRPYSRYTSVGLLKSIRRTELDSLRQTFPDVLNKLPSDDYYSDDGHPAGAEEVLQNWEALRAMITYCTQEKNNVREALHGCRLALNFATELYANINSIGIPLRQRSSDQHIDAIKDELVEFERLAEL